MGDQNGLSGIPQLNLVKLDQVQRPEIDDIKNRVARLEAQEIAGTTGGGFLKPDGSIPLTADWDIGEDRRIKAEAIRARDNEGLRLEDDAGALGLLVADGGNVGIGVATPLAPTAPLHLSA